jgi:hypothetical protein
MADTTTLGSDSTVTTEKGNPTPSTEATPNLGNDGSKFLNQSDGLVLPTLPAPAQSIHRLNDGNMRKDAQQSIGFYYDPFARSGGSNTPYSQFETPQRPPISMSTTPNLGELNRQRRAIEEAIEQAIASQ